MNVKKMTRLAMLLALSLLLGMLESFLPILNGMIPGMKLGLANIAVLVTLYLYGAKEALFVTLMRVLCMGMLRTGLFHIGFYFSLFGALFSGIAMIAFKKIHLFSIVGVSIGGSLFHTFGQMIAVLFFLKTPSMLSYLPLLMISSLITGTLIGFLSKELIEILKKHLQTEKFMI